MFSGERFLLWTAVSLCVLFMLSGLWLFGRIRSMVAAKAVVIAPQGQARNGPGDDYSVAFTVPEGKELVVISEKGMWYEVGLKEEGIKGWMMGVEIEKI